MLLGQNTPGLGGDVIQSRPVPCSSTPADVILSISTSTSPDSQQGGANTTTAMSSSNTKRQFRCLSNQEREDVYRSLLLVSVDGSFQHGDLTKVAKHYNVSSGTVKRIWERAQESLQKNGRANVARKYSTGRGQQYTVEWFREQFALVPIDIRQSSRTTAEYLKLSTGTVHRLRQQLHLIPVPAIPPKNSTTSTNLSTSAVAAAHNSSSIGDPGTQDGVSS